MTAGSPGLGMAGAARLPSVCGRSCSLTDSKAVTGADDASGLSISCRSVCNKPCHFRETVTLRVVWAGSRWGHENEASFGAVRLGWGTLPVTNAVPGDR